MQLTEILKKNFRCGKETIEKISISDTVLILYSIKKPNISFLYKTLPTKAEIEQFKNGCFYLDGEIVDSLK